jgi:molybdenum cofactor synthesis domain-containing protein
MIDMNVAYDLINDYFNNKILYNIIDVEVINSLGFYSAEDVYSKINVPKFKTSMMDGYAIDINKIDLNSEVKVIKSIYVDDNTKNTDLIKEFNLNICVYVTTGSPIPDPFNCVIPIEYAQQIDYNKKIKFTSDAKELKEGSFIRKIGSDVKVDELVLLKNKIININDIGLLLSVGINIIKVFKTPSIAIVSTGDELADYKDNINKDNVIIDTNRIMLINLIKKDNPNWIIKDLGIIRDKIEKVECLFEQCVNEGVDILITSGGVSMGEKDLIKKYLNDKGEIIFGRLNMKPGKPTTFGRYKSVTVFGLPGNPVSCNVCYYLFINYAIRLFQNKNSDFPYSKVKARLIHQVTLDLERPEFSRGM